MKKLLDLFFTFAKVGVMTFGGGYAMLPILQREVVEGKGWATDEELTDYFAIGQCTPGIIAVNTGTFIGQKQAGRLGSLSAPAMPAEFYQSLFFHMLYPPTLQSLNKKDFVPVKGRSLGKIFVIPPVTCVPAYALPVTVEAGKTYWAECGSACSSGGIFGLLHYFHRALTIPDSL